MKKLSLFLGLIVPFAGFPVFFWSRTAASGVPFSACVYDIGRLIALICFVLIAFQYVLGARIKKIERGIGLGRLLAFHKGLGLILFTVPLAHPVLLLLSERLQGYSTPMSFFKILGMLALFFIWVSAGAAVLYGKIPLKYGAWKRIHRLAFAVFPLAFFHSILLGTTLQKGPMRIFWLILALVYVMILLAGIRRHYALRRQVFTVSAVSRETHDTWTLHFEGERRDYEPGQFMFLSLVRKGRVSESHPFTVASPPSRSGLSISVKAVGDFTSTIDEAEKFDAAFIDMPYGVFSFVHHDAERYVFIAGGIGITPFMSMLRYMHDRRIEKEVILIWGNKKEEDIVFRDELEHLAVDMFSLKVIHVLSRQGDWPGERGRIRAGLLRRRVNDFQKGEFFVCGPPRMMKAVDKTLLDLGVSKKRIHMERFALR